MVKTAIMRVWDVELGLAIHIKTPNGKNIVIDLGSKQDVSPLKSLSGQIVDLMVITHPHHDHFSDIRNIKDAYPKVLWSVQTLTREELLKGVRDEEKEDFYRYCDFVEGVTANLFSENSSSSEISFDGLTATIYYTGSCAKENINNFSAIVVLRLGKAKVVVCGDNEKESFEQLMKDEEFKDAVKDACVLVAAHHGRDSGYYEEFVSLVKPQITIISDTKKSATSVTGKYDEKTRGYIVQKQTTGIYEMRSCLTTRQDGNIEVVFGDVDSNTDSALRLVSTCCDFETNH